jgi:hemoglobin/transferrin/lactoferrin receptor protein
MKMIEGALRQRHLLLGAAMAFGASTLSLGLSAALAQTTQQPLTLPQVKVETTKKKSAQRTAKRAPAPTTPPPGIVVEEPAPASPLTVGADVTITGAELNRRQPQSLQGLFADQSVVATGGTTPASTKVYVHGIEDTMLNVQIDGARQPQRSGFHHNSNNLIDPAMLKGVAIDAGAASADAGPHALGGAIRYTTKDAADLLLPGRSFGGFAALSYDTNAHTFRRSGALYGKANGFEFVGYGAWADGDAYKDGRGDTVVASDVDLVNYLGKIAYEAPSGHRISFSAEHIQDEGIRPFRANFAMIPGFAIPYSFNETKRDTYTFQYRTTQRTDWYDPEVSFYSNKTTLYRPPTGSCAIGSVAGTCIAFGRGDFESIGGKAQNTFVVGPGKLTTGVDFYRDETIVDHFGANPLYGERLTNFGAYAQYRFSPWQQLRISTGVRLDINKLEAADGSDQENTGVSPNIAVEYDLTRNWMAKASYGYSFGGVPLYESFLIRGAIPAYAPGLDPQYGQKLKAGLQFTDGGFVAEASYFHTRIIDPVCPNCNPVANDGDIVSKGVDLMAKYTWRHAQLGVAYTHTETTVGGGPLTTNHFYYGTPFGDILKAYGHYEFAGTGVVVGFVSQFAFDYEKIKDLIGPGGAPYGTLQGYGVHNAFVQWQPTAVPNLTLRAEVANIFDTYYVDRATAVGGVIVPLASPGRTFLLSGKVEF